MKNSLFKRAIAAAATVPLALTQVVTGASAVTVNDAALTITGNETVNASGNTTFTLDKGVESSLAYITPGIADGDFEDQYIEVTDENGNVVAFEKYSDWNDKVVSALTKVASGSKATGEIDLEPYKDELISQLAKLENGKFVPAAERIFENITREPITYSVSSNGDITIVGKVQQPVFYGDVSNTIGGVMARAAKQYGDDSLANIDYSAVDVSGTYTIVIKGSDLRKGTNVSATFKYAATEGGEYSLTQLPTFALTKINTLKTISKNAINNSNILTAEQKASECANVDVKLDEYVNYITKLTDFASSAMSNSKVFDYSNKGNISAALKAANDFIAGKGYAKYATIPASGAGLASDSRFANYYNKAINKISNVLGDSYTVDISASDIGALLDGLTELKGQAAGGKEEVSAKLADLEEAEVRAYFAQAYPEYQVESVYKLVEAKADLSGAATPSLSTVSAGFELKRVVEIVTTTQTTTTGETTETTVATTSTGTDEGTTETTTATATGTGESTTETTTATETGTGEGTTETTTATATGTDEGTTETTTATATGTGEGTTETTTATATGTGEGTTETTTATATGTGEGTTETTTATGTETGEGTTETTTATGDVTTSTETGDVTTTATGDVTTSTETGDVTTTATETATGTGTGDVTTTATETTSAGPTQLTTTATETTTGTGDVTTTATETTSAGPTQLTTTATETTTGTGDVTTTATETTSAGPTQLTTTATETTTGTGDVTTSTATGDVTTSTETGDVTTSTETTSTDSETTSTDSETTSTETTSTDSETTSTETTSTDSETTSTETTSTDSETTSTETTSTDSETTSTETTSTDSETTSTETTSTDSETTSTETTTATGEETTTTTTAVVTNVISVNLSAVPGFYLDIDESFNLAQIKGLTLSYDKVEAYYKQGEDGLEYIGETVLEQGVTIDISDKVGFGTQTPGNTYTPGEAIFTHLVTLYATEDIFDNDGNLYCAAGDQLTVPVSGLPVGVTAYIGVKGDADLNNEVTSADASAVLKFYAALSTGKNAADVKFSTSPLVEDENDILDSFASFLADVDNFSDTNNWTTPKADRNITSTDASYILKYYAKISTSATPGAATWAETLNIR